jgi:hypothetical protein
LASSHHATIAVRAGAFLESSHVPEALVRLTARQRVLTFFVSRVTLMDGDDRWRGLEKALSTASKGLAWKLLYVTNGLSVEFTGRSSRP